jgi:hypothetical protein
MQVRVALHTNRLAEIVLFAAVAFGAGSEVLSAAGKRTESGG